MSNYTTHAARIAAARAIGAAERKTDEIVPLIVADLPDGFDASKRGAVAEAVAVWITGEADAAARPRQRTGGKGEQTTTDYGRGVDTLTRAVKRALKDTDTAPVEAVLRATLSGEGGGTVTVDMSTPLGQALLALIKGDAALAA